MNATIIETTETGAIPDGYRRLMIEETQIRRVYLAVKATGRDGEDAALVMDSSVAKFALLESDSEPVSLFVYDADDGEVIAGGDY